VKGLTDRQAQVMRAIIEYWSEHGYPPTMRELCRLLGIRSTHAIADNFEYLAKKGVLRICRARSRAIELSPEYMRYVVRGMARRWAVPLADDPTRSIEQTQE